MKVEFKKCKSFKLVLCGEGICWRHYGRPGPSKGGKAKLKEWPGNIIFWNYQGTTVIVLEESSYRC